MDAGHELAKAERLREVIVGPDRQADDEVGLGIAGGEHQHGDRSVLLDLLADLEPVEAGEHEVEDDEVRVGPSAQLHPRWPVAGDLHREALTAQPGRDRVGDRSLVLHDHHRACRGGRRYRACGGRHLGHCQPG